MMLARRSSSRCALFQRIAAVGKAGQHIHFRRADVGDEVGARFVRRSGRIGRGGAGFAGLGSAALIAAKGSGSAAGLAAAGVAGVAAGFAGAAAAGGAAGAFVAALAVKAMPPAFSANRMAPVPITARSSPTSVLFGRVDFWRIFIAFLSAHGAERLGESGVRSGRGMGGVIGAGAFDAGGDSLARRGQKRQFVGKPAR